MPTPGGRRHCPVQSGYFVRSGACALALATPSAMTSATVPIRFWNFMVVLQPSSESAIPGASSLEIPQVGRLLVLLGRHQVTVGAHEIVLLSDDHMMIVLRAIVGVPDRLVVAAELLGHGPGARERVIDYRDLDVQDVRVRLVLEEAF